MSEEHHQKSFPILGTQLGCHVAIAAVAVFYIVVAVVVAVFVFGLVVAVDALFVTAVSIIISANVAVVNLLL